ncbi:MAG: hypothetical protein AAGA56_02270 [Myxococcota bacterium]
MVGLSLLTLTAFVRPSWAADYGDDIERGKTAMTDGRWEDACRDFEMAEQKAGQLTVVGQYWLGRCHQERGALDTAYRAFVECERLSRQARDAKRADVARERMRELELRLAFARLDFARGAKSRRLTIELNGRKLPRRDWSRRIPLPEGESTLNLRARRRVPVRLTITAPPPGATTTVQIPRLKRKPKRVDDDGEDERDEAAHRGEAGQPPRRNPAFFWSGVGLTIAGGLGILVGTGLAIDENTGTAPAAVSFGAGGIMVATGIPFMAIFGRRAEPVSTSHHWAPYVGFSAAPNGGSIGLQGAF